MKGNVFNVSTPIDLEWVLFMWYVFRDSLKNPPLSYEYRLVKKLDMNLFTYMIIKYIDSLIVNVHNLSCLLLIMRSL